jgi:hypothetical protein
MKSKTIIIPSQTMTVYDWYDIQDEICKLMGITNEQFRDLKNSQRHFNTWCDSKGYGAKDPSGTARNGSQIWYKEYTEAPDGQAARPPYCDLWHLAIESVVPDEMHNDSIVTMYALEDYEDDPEYYHKNVDWKKAFFEAYNQVMLEVDPENEGISVKFSW